jgi:flagellar protein FliJ
MPRFVFQLDGVLRQRRHVEHEKQRELALAQRRMQELQEELRDLNDGVAASTEDVRREHLSGPLDMSFLMGHRRYLIEMQRKALALMQRMALAQRQVEQAQETLAGAARNRKIIEKLREKHHDRWLAALSRRELSEQDEIGMRLSYLNLADDPAEAVT